LKFTIAGMSLMNAVSLVSKAVDESSVMVVLAGILIRAENGEVEFQATDLNASVSYRVRAMVEEEGATVVSGRLLNDIVKNLPDSAVHFDMPYDGTTLLMTCDKSRFRLNTLNATDFPEFPHIDVTNSVTVPRETLADMVKRVRKFIIKDDTRPILKGIEVSVCNGTLSVAASDTYRIAVCNARLSDCDADFSAVIPGKVICDVMGAKTPVENVTIGKNDSQILMTVGNVTYVTRTLDGTFPNLKLIFPEGASTQAVIDPKMMAQALRRVSVFKQKEPRIRLDVYEDAQAVQMTSFAPDQGELSEVVDCEVEGSSLAIGVNPRFLADTLESLAGFDYATAGFNGSTQPMVVRAYGDIDFSALIVGMRI